MKRKSYITIFSVLVAISTLFSAISAYAWMYWGDKINGVKVGVTKIDSTLTLYEAVDVNRNGIPDLLGEGESGEESEGYYTEKYKFVNPQTTFAISEEPIDASVGITINNAFPSMVYTYKISIVNRGDANNRLVFNLIAPNGEPFLLSDGAGGVISGSEADALRLASVTSCRFATVEYGGEINYLDKVYFYDYFVNGGFSQNVLLYEDGVVCGTIHAEQSEKRNYFDCWVQFEIEPFDELISRYGNNFITRNDYNLLQGKQVEYNGIAVSFQIDSSI